VIIMGAYLGVHLGAWTNFKLGILRGPPLTKPYPIMWPAINQWGLPLLRMVIGGVICVAIRAIFKPLTYFVTCRLMGVDMKKVLAQKNDIRNKHKVAAEISYKFITYMMVGFGVQCIAPIVFQAIGCERSTFHTEV
jgi:sphingosine-1-phosphate phosphatase 1